VYTYSLLYTCCTHVHMCANSCLFNKYQVNIINVVMINRHSNSFKLSKHSKWLFISSRWAWYTCKHTQLRTFYCKMNKMCKKKKKFSDPVQRSHIGDKLQSQAIFCSILLALAAPQTFSQGVHNISITRKAHLEHLSEPSMLLHHML